ncbi:hypothetical protein ACFYVR_15930 [Rhodococcus sp. NPDC003318]|uniref:hypothetical protein n=1 Tax=Rhodococcus sp. NPDC003318 TaxID=3364503 RepID=UPI0036AB1188
MTHFFLDEDGQARLLGLLDEIPEVVDALAGLRGDGYRQRISYEPKVTGGGGEAPLPYDTGAGDAADELHAELASWVRLTLDHRGQEWGGGSTALALARWLREHLVALAMTPGSEEAPAGIGRAVRNARRVARMTARPEDWRMRSVHVARNAQLNARGIEQAAKELGPEYARLTADRVRNLKRRDRIKPIREIDGELIYRLGEVMEAHLAAKTRRGTA